MAGSGVFARAFTPEHALAQRDREGASVCNALTRIRYAGDSAKPHTVSAYFEALIEQGAVLEAHHKTIGVVQGALGQRWYDVTVHAIGIARSPTPMTLCLDALLAAVDPIQAVQRHALDHAPHGRATVVLLDAHRNSRNVIPVGVTLTVGLRAADGTPLTAMDRALLAACSAAAQQSRIAADV
jgi:N-carbamoyl-L-amino-acid hydrolase